MDYKTFSIKKLLELFIYGGNSFSFLEKELEERGIEIEVLRKDLNEVIKKHLNKDRVLDCLKQKVIIRKV